MNVQEIITSIETTIALLRQEEKLLPDTIEELNSQPIIDLHAALNRELKITRTKIQIIKDVKLQSETYKQLTHLIKISDAFVGELIPQLRKFKLSQMLISLRKDSIDEAIRTLQSLRDQLKQQTL